MYVYKYAAGRVGQMCVCVCVRVCMSVCKSAVRAGDFSLQRYIYICVYVCASVCVCVCVCVYTLSAGRAGNFSLLRWPRSIPQGAFDRQKQIQQKKVSICVRSKREKYTYVIRKNK